MKTPSLNEEELNASPGWCHSDVQIDFCIDPANRCVPFFLMICPAATAAAARLELAVALALALVLPVRCCLLLLLDVFAGVDAAEAVAPAAANEEQASVVLAIIMSTKTSAAQLFFA